MTDLAEMAHEAHDAIATLELIFRDYAEAIDTEVRTRFKALRLPRRVRPNKSHHCSNTRKPITIRGVAYPSYTAAAAALNVSVPTIVKTVKDRRNVDNIGLEKAGFRVLRKPPKARNSKPTTIDGITYPSMTAAARATGIHRSKLLPDNNNHCEGANNAPSSRIYDGSRRVL